MRFLLYSPRGPVTETREVPARYRQHRIPGAAPCHIEGNFGNYLTQIISGIGFCIQMNIFTILVRTCLQPYVEESLITLHFMIQRDILCRLKGYGKAWLYEGIYNLFYVPGGELHEAWFQPGTYLSFHIDLSLQFLQRLAVRYPDLKEVVEKLLHHSKEGVQQHPAHITRGVVRLLEELKHCPYQEEPDKSIYLENRIRELLLLYVHDTPTQEDKRSPLVTRKMKNINYYMELHLEEHLTISGIAERFHLSKSTLKRWFGQYFQQPFHKHLLELRMQYAKELLSNTDLTVLGIAEKTGYSDAASFSHAFSHFTGLAPGHFRTH